MAGKRGGFFSRLLKEDSSKPPLTDADRDRWLDAQAVDGPPSWGRPQQEPGATPSGVDVVEMSPESPLGTAGIEEGDVITAVNGMSTPTETSLAEALNRLGPGERADVSVIRNESQLRITVVAPG